jgi:hypothetical protein
MTYCIFLKSLRILEEFRKNPCVKIPPKSPCTNFQRLGKFKNSIFISKNFSSVPPQLPRWPVRPFGPAGLTDPTRPSRSPVPYLQPKPAPTPSRSRATAPLPPGPPWLPFLPVLVLPLLLYSLAITSPLQVAS